MEPASKSEAKPLSLEDRLKGLHDPMENETRRAHIEGKLSPIDISQFLFQGYVEQDIPLALPITFRTTTTRHSLWIERILADLVGKESMLYAGHFGQILNLAACTHSVGKAPDVRVLADLWLLEAETDYEVYKSRIQERVSFFGKLPSQVTDDFSTNLNWFQQRVRLRLSSTGASDLGN